MIFTDEQQKVIDYLLEQANSPVGKNVIVSGQGGTGKTTVVCEVICRLVEQGDLKVVVMAMTGKATDVLRNKVVLALQERGRDIEEFEGRLKIETVTKITKISKPLGTRANGETVFQQEWRDPELFKGDVLIIDELSMVPVTYSFWWQKTSAKVFGFGDFCQIPEVWTSDTSSEYKTLAAKLKLKNVRKIKGYGVKVLKNLATLSLTHVLRSTNDIALLCNDLRDFDKTKSWYIQTIKDWATKSDKIFFSDSIQDIEKGFDWQIICYTNKLCSIINNRLCIGEEYPSLQDKIMLNTNISELSLFNGMTMKFEDLILKIDEHNAQIATIERITDRDLTKEELAIQKTKTRTHLCIKWQGNMPNPKSNNPIEQEQAIQRELAQQASRQQQIARKRAIKEWLTRPEPGFRRQSYTEFQRVFEQTILPVTNYLQIEEAILDFFDQVKQIDEELARILIDYIPASLTIKYVDINYGYAITTHKSQGSEYENVCYLLERYDKPLVYTGLSRAKSKLKIIDLTKKGES